IGTGNSPPARKRAASPESVVKLGSANPRANPLVSSAEINKSTEPPLLVRTMLVNKLANGTGATPPAVPTSVFNVPSNGMVPAGGPTLGIATRPLFVLTELGPPSPVLAIF